MNEIALEELLAQADSAGVFFVTENDLEAIELAAQNNNAYFCGVDLYHCQNKTQLFAMLAAALQFPPSFGKNWDALADYLSDLSWLAADSFVLYFSNAHRYRDLQEEDFKTLIEILEEASASWGEQKSAFWAFIALPDEEFEQMQSE